MSVLLQSGDGRARSFSTYLPNWLTGSREVRCASHRDRAGPLYPIGGFERVLPMDLLATPLLRSLLARDIETAQALGALELEEEDLALCSYICPGGNDYGAALRDCLNALERRR